MFWWRAADIFFLVFHLAFIVFVLTGWIWKTTRKWHLAAILLTLASWFVLGIWYGWGYCPLTDWHWNILHKLGHYGLPSSYVAYLVQRVLGISPPASLVDYVTLGMALLALGLSVWVNFFPAVSKRKP